ncbi:alanine--tRNA ligase-related protein (plasmid) [Streptomyces sp. HUAS TT11]|uniref:alanine--tRNA ligase-related protein n=1 Tax=Streptomyces sp. HUAS TT11 TaxID=3447508 RepID=UPI003F659981
MSDALAAQGYRRQPPTPSEPARVGLFPCHLDPAWSEPLTASLRYSYGGAHTLRWSIGTRSLHAVPTVRATAQRVLSAAWTGHRPLHVSLRGVTRAVAGTGLRESELAFVVRASPAVSDDVRGALDRLGVEAQRIGSDRQFASAGRTTMGNGPDLSLEFPVGLPCGSLCGPGCRCGRYLVLAQFHCMTSYRTSPLLRTEVFESGLQCALEDTREHFGVRRFAELVEAVRAVLRAHGTRTAQAQRVRLLVDRTFTAALLLGSGFMPGPRGRAHVVRSLLRQAETELVLSGVPLDRIEGLVVAADRTVRAGLGLPALTDDTLGAVHQEHERFARVLAGAPALLTSAVTRFHQPSDRARALLRLRNTHGVPLAVATAWCREHDVAVSVHHVARLDWNHKAGVTHAS